MDSNVVLGTASAEEDSTRPRIKTVDLGDGTSALAVVMPLGATILAELQAIRALLEEVRDNTDETAPGLAVRVLPGSGGLL